MFVAWPTQSIVAGMIVGEVHDRVLAAKIMAWFPTTSRACRAA
jgi:hypothetical protein